MLKDLIDILMITKDNSINFIQKFIPNVTFESVSISKGLISMFLLYCALIVIQINIKSKVEKYPHQKDKITWIVVCSGLLVIYFIAF